MPGTPLAVVPPNQLERRRYGVEDEMQEIAAEIERHLREQPMAADSAEGIRRWWIGPAIGERALDAVLRALEDLERRGVVERRPVQGGAIIWGAHRSTRH